MEKSLEDYCKEITIKQCCCGEKLEITPGNIQHEDHSCGWKVKGYEKPQWLYITCGKCGYDWALWKLGVKKEN